MTSTDIAPRLSITETMATKFGMAAGPFEATLRATVFPANGSREQFAAFLMVANQYGLNPVTREIYAFPGRGGGITPIVSIDGWINIINSHPMLDGIEFDDCIDDNNQMTAITARIWRKDRNKPITVTEYLAECDTGTATWKKYPCRMLRHKALIQAARYAFGFAGIVDPDEAERIEAATVTKVVAPPRPSGAAAYAAFAGNSRAAEVRRTQDDPAESQEPGPAPAHIAGPTGTELAADEAGPAPGDIVRPPDEPVAEAWQRGREDRAKGVLRKAVPPQYRTPERDAEALAWARGWTGEPLA